MSQPSTPTDRPQLYSKFDVGSIDSNIPELAEKIFSQPPKEPYTINLELQMAPDIGSRTPAEAQTIFEVLSHMLMCGMRVKYGERQDPKHLTPQQIDTLNKYMRSMGFNVVVNAYETHELMDETNPANIAPKQYKPIDIEFYRLRMVDNEHGVWYDIKIEPYRAPMGGRGNNMFANSLL